MSNVFERFFTHDITSIAPRIVDLEQPTQILGMTVDTNLKTVYRDIPALGKRQPEIDLYVAIKEK